MLKTNVLDMSGKVVGEIELSEAVFGVTPNTAVVHDVVAVHKMLNPAGFVPKGCKIQAKKQIQKVQQADGNQQKRSSLPSLMLGVELF